MTQRVKRNELSSDRIEKLESLAGWAWDAVAYRWEEGYSRLQAFVRNEGNARVPNRLKTTDGYELGLWVSRQRRRAEKNKLSGNQLARLESLSGWAWNLKTYHWEEGYACLESFAKNEGHARVPRGQKAENGFNLGNWVRTQKQKKEQLPEDRAARLESLPGWEW
jgi:hypothetical protein